MLLIIHLPTVSPLVSEPALPLARSAFPRSLATVNNFIIHKCIKNLPIYKNIDFLFNNLQINYVINDIEVLKTVKYYNCFKIILDNFLIGLYIDY